MLLLLFSFSITVFNSFFQSFSLTLYFPPQLYTHIPIMRKILRQLEDWNYKLCGIFILDSHFVDFPSKFVSGTLYCLSAMMQMELAQVRVFRVCVCVCLIALYV